jgi:2-polyprenyl-6-methoxyphenol hydroxylase-like FAD-dependent oxidoreductase
MSKAAVLVIGAGIAGPAVGIALRRAGFQPVIYEASDGPRDDAGAFLNVAPNGLSVLRTLGLDGIVQRRGFQNDRLVFQNESGRRLASVPVGGVTIMRGALSRALREAAEQAGVRCEFGKALTSIEAHAGGVVAHFLDGTIASAGCLVGADGLHSRTRDCYFPGAPKPAYTGILNLGGVVRTSLPPTGTAMHMIFGHRGFFGYAVQPGGDTYWFSNFVQRGEPARGSLAKVSADQYRRELCALHRSDPPEIGEILRAISGDIGAFAVYDIPSLPMWHRGTVCLIGDAAHAVGPHVGQGTSLALEDAVVLAKCLRDIRDPAHAFATFERQRRSRVERIVRQSRRTGQQKASAGWIARKMRDLVLPVFLRKGAAAAGEMYRYRVDWDEPIAPQTEAH